MLSGGYIYAQEVEVDAKIDSTNILIGDQADLSLKIIQPDSLNILFPVFTDTIKRNIEIINQTARDTLLLDNNMIEITKKYKITCFDSGSYHIPPFIFTHKGDSLISNWATQPLFLNVSRVNIAPADSSEVVFDIKLPDKMPLTLAEILPWLLGAILAGLLIFFVAIFISKRKKKEPVFKRKEPEKPPHVIALRELDNLKEKRLWQKGKIKLYYSELTYVIRKYIERRYQINALEQTSNEIIESLEKSGFRNNKQSENLKSILFLADMVKFAKVNPLPGENETALLNSYVFINETKQTYNV